MVRFVDTHSYLAYSGLIIAALGFVSAPFFASTRWTKIIISLIASTLLYNILRATWPDTFPSELKEMLGYEAALFGGFLLIMSFAAELALFSAAMVLVGPILSHNSSILADWLHANVNEKLPEWSGLALFVLALGAVILVLWLSRIISFLAHTVRIILASLNLTVFISLALLENPPDMDKLDISCGEKKDGGRCPLSLDNASVIVLFLILTVILAAAVIRVRTGSFGCRERVEKQKKKKKPTKVSVQQHRYEAVELSSPTPPTAHES